MNADLLTSERSVATMLARLVRPLVLATEDAVQRLGLAIEAGPETEQGDAADSSALPAPAREHDPTRQPADAASGPMRAPAAAVSTPTSAPLASAAANGSAGARPLRAVPAPFGPSAPAAVAAGATGGQAPSAPAMTADWAADRTAPHLAQAAVPEPHRTAPRIETTPAGSAGPEARRHASAPAPPSAASLGPQTPQAPQAPSLPHSSTPGAAPGSARVGHAPGALPVAAAPEKPAGDGSGVAAEAFGAHLAAGSSTGTGNRDVHVVAPRAATGPIAPPPAVSSESAGEAASDPDNAATQAAPTNPTPVAAAGVAAPAPGVLRLARAPAADGTAAPPETGARRVAEAGSAAPPVGSPRSMTAAAEPQMLAPSSALRRVATRLDRALAPVFSRAAAAIEDAESTQAADASGASSSAAEPMSNPDAGATAPSTQINNTFNVKVSMAGSGGSADPRQIEEQLADWLRASARRQGLLA